MGTEDRPWPRQCHGCAICCPNNASVLRDYYTTHPNQPTRADVPRKPTPYSRRLPRFQRRVSGCANSRDVPAQPSVISWSWPPVFVHSTAWANPAGDTSTAPWRLQTANLKSSIRDKSSPAPGWSMSFPPAMTLSFTRGTFRVRGDTSRSSRSMRNWRSGPRCSAMSIDSSTTCKPAHREVVLEVEEVFRLPAPTTPRTRADEPGASAALEPSSKPGWPKLDGQNNACSEAHRPAQCAPATTSR